MATRQDLSLRAPDSDHGPGQSPTWRRLVRVTLATFRYRRLPGLLEIRQPRKTLHASRFLQVSHAPSNEVICLPIYNDARTAVLSGRREKAISSAVPASSPRR